MAEPSEGWSAVALDAAATQAAEARAAAMLAHGAQGPGGQGQVATFSQPVRGDTERQALAAASTDAMAAPAQSDAAALAANFPHLRTQSQEPAAVDSAGAQSEAAALAANFPHLRTQQQDTRTVPAPLSDEDRVDSSHCRTVPSTPRRTISGTVEFIPAPSVAVVGARLNVEIPGTGGQGLLVDVPHGYQPGQPLRVPFEVTHEGVLLHPISCPVAGYGQSVLAPVSVKDVPERPSYCNGRVCCEVSCLITLLICSSSLPPSIMASFEEDALLVIGMILAAVNPTCILMSYTYHKFKKSLLKTQLVITFLEAIVWMIPFLAFFIGMRLLGLLNWCKCKRECDDCDWDCEQTPACYCYDAFHAFVLAAGWEEFLKYLCVRRIAFSSFVVDVHGLFVYGGCAALGFATAENILYLHDAEITTAVVRSVLSVPMHMSCGLMIGSELGKQRFLNKRLSMLNALGIPVLVHGAFDLSLYAFLRMYLPGVGALLCAASAICGWLYVRYLVRSLGSFPQVDVHQLMRDGTVDRPDCWCCFRLCGFCVKPTQAGDTGQAGDAPEKPTSPAPARLGAPAETPIQVFKEPLSGSE